MTFVRRSGTTTVAPTTAKRRSGSAWASIQTMRRRLNGAWITVWSAVVGLSPTASTRSWANGQAASATFTGSGGNGTYAWSLVGSGLTLSSASGASVTVTAPGRTSGSLLGTLTCTSNGASADATIEWSWGTPV